MIRNVEGVYLEKRKILVIEDDADIREIIRIRLVKEGFHIIEAEDGEKGINKALEIVPDLIVLDIMLPGIDGFEVCREIRKKIDTPVIFLSCKDADEDKIIGLTLGGDDYITKPFSMGEFLARVRVQLRKKIPMQLSVQKTEDDHFESDKNRMVFEDLEIDLKSHSVRVKGQEIELTNKEFRLLTMLARHPNSVFSNEHIFNSIWGYESFGDYRTIMVHMSNLRKKIEADPVSPEYIHTIKGVGYKFTPKKKVH